MNWTRERERGGAALRLMAWIARTAGWHLSYALLYPITAVFLATAPRAQRAAALRFHRRALGREPGWRDLWRQYFTFAATLLDRVFLLSGRTRGFDIRVTGLDAIQARVSAGEGCILLGAHLGSFEAMRALADSGCPVEVMALMHGQHAANANALFADLGPRQAAAVVSLGRPDAMLRAKECLERGGLVGILADRDPEGCKVARVDFLGAPAPLPVGPFILAGVLDAPVMLAFGIWRGPRRYEVRFEPFADRIVLDRRNRQGALTAYAARYATRLGELARAHPGNWFNFYEFWDDAPRSPEPEQQAVTREAVVPAARRGVAAEEPAA
ncbi:hypothetical protein [Muricoccus radiodurans]|uniref:LpxL/LpxP family acyltransferase n=1 Tax=Muricoccus radiodurans TaxID=2231721 RepID=UPI003CEA7085